MNNSSSKTIYQVSELTRQIQQMLESSYRSIWVEAEISSLSKPASGHWYFSLKDDSSQIRCAMFRNRAGISAYKPNEGDLVRVRGKVTVYAARGDMQMIIEHVEAAGEGLLQKQFDELKAKLQIEGLFSQEIKKSIPKLPKSIGLITSPTGAAIQDILSTLKRRFPSIPVRIYPTVVQGSAAASQIIAALQFANNENTCDVLILTRGGGSLEDLWCFNDEQLVRSIVTSNIPLISAVGHEVDITLSDFAADLRAPTPTAAAEIVSPDKQEFIEQLLTTKARLIRSQERYLTNLAQNIDWLSKRLRHPAANISQYHKRLEQLQQALLVSQQRQLRNQRTSMVYLNNRLKQLNPDNMIRVKKQAILELNLRIKNAIKRTIETNRQKFDHLSAQLSTVSHERTLDRGYAIIENQSGEIVTKSWDLHKDDSVIITHADGSKRAVIEK